MGQVWERTWDSWGKVSANWQIRWSRKDLLQSILECEARSEIQTKMRHFNLYNVLIPQAKDCIDYWAHEGHPSFEPLKPWHN